MTEWQPIDTAPTDKNIIMWLEDEGFAVTAKWVEWNPGEWDFLIWELDTTASAHCATHWMPLPSPPK